MAGINPYLNFQGNTEEAFNFYKSVFGGEFAGVMRWSDMQGNRVPDSEKNKIMHIALPIGKGNVLMGTDALESKGEKLVQGNNIYICIDPDSKEEADKLFNGLSAGGKTVMPMEDAFWGDYFGMCDDKFGIHWMISFNPNKK